MSARLAELADACLLPAFDGLVAPDWLLDRLGSGLGGVTLFARNIGSPQQVAALTAQLRNAAPTVVVAIDEEGGDVTRLEVATGSSYPGNLALGAVDDVDVTRRVAASIGADLRGAGVNLNLGPVADVNSNPNNPVIGVRSFGPDAELVARHAAAYVEGLQSAGVAACTKHFPGHGDTAEDSHHGLPTVTDSADALDLALQPFRAAIKSGTRAIMTAHIVVPQLGVDPGTINPRILTDLLRRELGFEGLIVTDALDMGAIRQGVGDVEGAVRALIAGADALCLSGREERDVLDAIREGIVAAVVAGRLSEARLRDAGQRVRSCVTWDGPPAMPRDGKVGLVAARRGLRSVGDVRLRADNPFVVQLEPAANMAAGIMPWGVATPLRELGADVDSVTLFEADANVDPLIGRAHQPVVLVLRDAARHAWQRGLLQRICHARPDTIVVEMGLPGTPAPDAAGQIVTHGAGLVNAVAAAEQLLGRTIPEVF
ncbi:MAG: glycoside hydrolase family 3 protein [Mycobacteriales bacterium]